MPTINDYLNQLGQEETAPSQTINDYLNQLAQEDEESPPKRTVGSLVGEVGEQAARMPGGQPREIPTQPGDVLAQMGAGGWEDTDAKERREYLGRTAKNLNKQVSDVITETMTPWVSKLGTDQEITWEDFVPGGIGENVAKGGINTIRGIYHSVFGEPEETPESGLSRAVSKALGKTGEETKQDVLGIVDHYKRGYFTSPKDFAKEWEENPLGMINDIVALYGGVKGVFALKGPIAKGLKAGARWTHPGSPETPGLSPIIKRVSPIVEENARKSGLESVGKKYQTVHDIASATQELSDNLLKSVRSGQGTGTISKTLAIKNAVDALPMELKIKYTRDVPIGEGKTLSAETTIEKEFVRHLNKAMRDFPEKMSFDDFSSHLRKTTPKLRMEADTAYKQRILNIYENSLNRPNVTEYLDADTINATKHLLRKAVAKSSPEDFQSYTKRLISHGKKELFSDLLSATMGGLTAGPGGAIAAPVGKRIIKGLIQKPLGLDRRAGMPLVSEGLYRTGRAIEQIGQPKPTVGKQPPLTPAERAAAGLQEPTIPSERPRPIFTGPVRPPITPQGPPGSGTFRTTTGTGQPPHPPPGAQSRIRGMYNAPEGVGAGTRPAVVNPLPGPPGEEVTAGSMYGLPGMSRGLKSQVFDAEHMMRSESIEMDRQLSNYARRYAKGYDVHNDPIKKTLDPKVANRWSEPEWNVLAEMEEWSLLGGKTPKEIFENAVSGTNLSKKHTEIFQELVNKPEYKGSVRKAIEGELGMDASNMTDIEARRALWNYVGEGIDDYSENVRTAYRNFKAVFPDIKKELPDLVKWQKQRAIKSNIVDPNIAIDNLSFRLLSSDIVATGETFDTSGGNKNIKNDLIKKWEPIRKKKYTNPDELELDLYVSGLGVDGISGNNFNSKLLLNTVTDLFDESIDAPTPAPTPAPEPVIPQNPKADFGPAPKLPPRSAIQPPNPYSNMLASLSPQQQMPPEQKTAIMKYLLPQYPFLTG